MSKIVVEHTISQNPPEEPKEIMYWDVEIEITVNHQERHPVLGTWETMKAVKIQMGARMYGEADDEFRKRLLMASYVRPEIHSRSAFYEETPVEEFEMNDPHGVLAWLGLTLENINVFQKGLIGPLPQTPTT